MHAWLSWLVMTFSAGEIATACGLLAGFAAFLKTLLDLRTGMFKKEIEPTRKQGKSKRGIVVSEVQWSAFGLKFAKRTVQILVVILAVAVPSSSILMTSDSANPSSNPGTAQQSIPRNSVGDVRFEALERSGYSKSTPSRDVFRFEAKRTTPIPAASTGEPVAPAPVGPVGPVGPPPVPPIPLRYIGYLDQPGGVPRIGVLSDGRGNVFSGKEGDVLEGRYRILRLGSDSADLIYVDGRGRQTVRLSGQ